MTPQEFAQKIKSQYPQYQNVPDAELTNKIIEKYPVYKSQITTPTVEQPKQSLGTQVMDTAGGVLDTVFGGGTIGEAIGTKIAEMQATPEEKAAVEQLGTDTFKGPTGMQIAGDALRVGSTFLPVGKIAGAASQGLKAVGIGGKLGQIAGQSIAGGTVGLAADTGLSMAEGGGPKVGLGTAIGAGIPFVAPVVKGVSGLLGKLGGKVASETLGMSTGTSAETLEQAFDAARKGGKEMAKFTEALRGQVTPEQVALSLRENVARVASERSQAYANSLSQIGNEVVDTVSAKASFADKLKEVGIKITNEGLDFSNSKLDLVPAAQSKIVAAYNKVLGLSDNMSLADLDNARQALKALSLAGDDPSANLANKLIDDAVRGVRTSGEKVTGYGKMLDEFGEQSEFLGQLQRDLMSGDRATIDQTFRRMVTSLKTNNEQRAALIKELDEATGGAVLSTVAGQQLSEALPRGIIRQIAGTLAGGAAITGGISAAWLPALTIASPRVVGEVVRGLGIASNKADAVISAIGSARNTLIKIGAIAGAVNDGSDDE